MVNKKDLTYVLSLTMGILIVVIIFLHYDVYLWGKPATLYIYTERKCELCEEFVSFAKTTLANEGYTIKVCYLDVMPECNETYSFMKSMGLPDIVPMNIIVRKNEVRGIVLGVWEGMPFWYVMRDTKLNGTSIIPVYKWGDLIGFITSNSCLIQELPKALEENNPYIIIEKCGSTDNFTYIYVGAFHYTPSKTP